MSSSNSKPIRLGVCGLGGYARVVLKMLQAAADKFEPRFELVAACDLDLAAHGDLTPVLKDRGVSLYENYAEMLKHPALDVVWLPLPIQLHAPYTKQAVAAGIAVICEKPTAGCIDDLYDMIKVRDESGQPVFISYHTIPHSACVKAKTLLMEGVIGKVQHASLVASWPRHLQYYNRNNWAGRLKVDQTWVLDSPMNNALSHFVNLVLYLLGSSFDAWADPCWLDVELYRANKIENFDTVCAQLKNCNKTTAQVILTHAAKKQFGPELKIVGDQGVMWWEQDRIRIARHGEAVEVVYEHGDDDIAMRLSLVKSAARFIYGMPADGVSYTTLESTIPHMKVVCGASEATPVYDVPAEFTYTYDDPSNGPAVAIKGFEEVISACSDGGLMLHESGLLQFAKPHGSIDLTDYVSFAGPAEYQAISTNG
ncbi:Gfo/Idh/MocA family protein [Poriferisphaera sp. WC338]|uniref:Gfo/Idh/MocA family protein n=1 Tax=Poriferisphaera sp. WC338 TaxID=3425129 RepID=UPI003D818F99